MGTLSDYIDRAENAEDPSATVAELLRDLSSGKVKHEDVHAHYKARNMPRLNEAVMLFGKGDLFAAQRQDYGTWLSGAGWHKDYERALNFRALEDLCGVQVEGVRGFIHAMVQPSPGARQRDAERAGSDDHSRQWSARTIKGGWRW